MKERCEVENYAEYAFQATRLAYQIKELRDRIEPSWLNEIKTWEQWAYSMGCLERMRQTGGF
jgi:hypothetical protein